jgi:outer membrane receptor protein involved in Fe transport
MYINLDSLRGNPDLQPEDALDGDIGLRWQSTAISVEAAYFRRWIKNLILFAFVSPYQVEARNYSGTMAHGVEASLDARLPLGLRLSASYTYTRTRLGDPPVLELPGHPRHRLVTRLGWQHQLGSAQRWRVGLWSGLTAESSMHLDRHNSESPVFHEEGRALLSAGGSISYRSLSLSAEGRNLLDKRDAVDTLGFPIAPARFLISLAAEL